MLFGDSDPSSKSKCFVRPRYFAFGRRISHGMGHVVVVGGGCCWDPAGCVIGSEALSVRKRQNSLMYVAWRGFLVAPPLVGMLRRGGPLDLGCIADGRYDAISDLEDLLGKEDSWEADC